MKYKFCPMCAGQFKKASFNLYLCGSCKHQYYLNPKCTNAVIFENKEGEVLLTRRKYPPKVNFWDLPGGFIDIKESAEDSVRREIMEELGVKVGNFFYLGSYPDFYFYQKLKYYTLNFIYCANVEGLQLVPNDDVSAIKFFSKKRIPFERIAFKSLKQAIKDYINKVGCK